MTGKLTGRLNLIPPPEIKTASLRGASIEAALGKMKGVPMTFW